MREVDLYSIWAKQSLNHDLYTTSGQAVRVIYPGNLNTDRGADFKDAFLRIGNEEFHGDVEIHVKKGDWLQHKHQVDPEYNKVILHLIWENDNSQIFTQAEREIPTVLLSEFFLPNPEIEANLAYNCHFFSGLDKLQLNYLLFSYGRKRLREKADHIRQASYLEPYEDTIYRVIAESLGSPNNKLGMKLLAERIKKRDLQAISKAKLESYIEKIIKDIGLGPGQVGVKEVWQKFRVRPASQPIKRVREFINIRWSLRNDNLAIILWEIYLKSNSIKEVLLGIDEILNKNLPASKLGQQIIRIISYNSILPFLYSMIYTSQDKKNLAKIDHYIKEFPRIGNNRVINTFMSKISAYQSKNLICREVYYQGLYYLMNNYCRRHDCQLCHQEKEEYLTIRE
jgi:hypothetical protein